MNPLSLHSAVCFLLTSLSLIALLRVIFWVLDNCWPRGTQDFFEDFVFQRVFHQLRPAQSFAIIIYVYSFVPHANVFQELQYSMTKSIYDISIGLSLAMTHEDTYALTRTHVLAFCLSLLMFPVSETWLKSKRPKYLSWFLKHALL